MKWFKHDRYKRILGKVMAEGQDINLEQIRAGFARHGYQRDQLPSDWAVYPVYPAAVEKSHMNALGLCADSLPVSRWGFEHAVPAMPEAFMQQAFEVAPVHKSRAIDSVL